VLVKELVDVTAVQVVGDHRLRLTFSDGTIGDVDSSTREWRGVLEPLNDPAYFARVRVDAESGTIAWPNGVDLAPEPLHEQAGETRPRRHRPAAEYTPRPSDAQHRGSPPLVERRPRITAMNGERRGGASPVLIQSLNPR
jgi:uncharacterized protein DUF2442